MEEAVRIGQEVTGLDSKHKGQMWTLGGAGDGEAGSGRVGTL